MPWIHQFEGIDYDRKHFRNSDMGWEELMELTRDMPQMKMLETMIRIG